MNQVKQIMDQMDLEGRGIVDGSGYVKPAGATADDPDGRRAAKQRRRAAFEERLWGKLPEPAGTRQDGPILEQ